MALCVHSRYRYTIILWLVVVDQSDPVAEEPYIAAGISGESVAAASSSSSTLPKPAAIGDDGAVRPKIWVYPLPPALGEGDGYISSLGGKKKNIYFGRKLPPPPIYPNILLHNVVTLVVKTPDKYIYK